MANPKPVKPIVGKAPPKQWLTAAITKYGDWSKSRGVPMRVNGDPLAMGGGKVNVVRYKATNGNLLYLDTAGIDGSVTDKSGKLLVALTTPVGPVEPDVLTPELNTAKANPLDFVGEFEKFLTSDALWVRVGEIVVGIVLVTVGFSKTFPTTTRAIKKVIR